MKIQERYLRPKNCSFLLAPKVNPELWDDLSDHAKGRELGLQSLQKLFVKSLYPLARMANKLVQAKSLNSESIPIADVYPSAIDAMTLLGNALYEFSMKRRELLKPEVAAGFKSLCRDSQPITTWLFGDELPQIIRDIAQVKLMSVKKFSSKRKFDGPSTSTGKRFNGDSYQLGSLNFKRRSDPYRPWRGRRWNYRPQSGIQRFNLQTCRQQMSTQQPQ